MPATKVQLTGGAFQDSEGNVLALGYLKMKLSQDALISGVGQICSGIEITINLDSSGDVVASPAQSVWGNDQMTPANSYYRVFGYKANGQLAWGPNNQQVNGSGGTFSLGSWTPNTVISWTPAIQIPELQVNGVDNAVQDVLNLKDTASVTWIDDGNGSVEATAATTELQVNGVDNVDQALLNFVDTASVAWTDNGGGSVSATATVTASIFPPVIRGVLAQVNGASVGLTIGDGEALGATGTGSTNAIQPTSTDLGGAQFLNNSNNNDRGLGGNISAWNMATCQSWSMRVKPEVTTDARYWIGFWDGSNNYNGHFTTDDTISRLGGTPSGVGAVVAFRFSQGVDSAWQAYVQLTDGVSDFLVTTTGVAFDTTASHLFTIQPNGSGSVKFYIDEVLVATVTSAKVPALSTPMTTLACSDGKGVITDASFVFYYVLQNMVP
jgi:hypothetical protein